MKTLALLVLTLVGSIGSSTAQLLLSTGQSFTYEFSTLEFFGDGFTGYGPNGINFATFYSNPALTTPDAVFTVDLFENNVSETPIATASGNDFVTALAAGGWHDLQGVGRVTVTAGTVGLDSMIFQVYRPTPDVPGEFESYSSGTITLVPEPGTIALFGIGLLGLLVSGLKRR